MESKTLLKKFFGFTAFYYVFGHKITFLEIFCFVEFARKKIVEEEKVNCVIFGHIGVGILHTNLLFGGGEEKDAQKAKKEIFEFVISQGGAITGEHGTGVSKKDFIQSELGEQTLNFMIYMKNKIDPKNIFNPTKLPLPKRGCIDIG